MDTVRFDGCTQKEIQVLKSGFQDPYSTTLKSTGTVTAALEPKILLGTILQLRTAFCKGLHSTHYCKIATDYQKRVEIVKRDKLYFNCLAHHKVSNCQSKLWCKKCKKYHTTLCNSVTPSKSIQDKVTDNKPPASSLNVAGLLHLAPHPS